MTAAPARGLLVYVEGGRIGDMLNLLPGIRRLRECFPGQHVCWLTGRETSTLGTMLRPLSAAFVDEFVDEAGIGVRWRELLARPLPGRRFDSVIDCQTRLRCTLVLKRIRHRQFVTRAAGYRLSDRRPAPGPPPATVLDQFLTLISLASGRPCTPDFTLDLPDGYREAAARLLPAGPVYVGLGPGAHGAARRWPLARYVELARGQAARARTPVFFLGPEEVAWRAEIEAAVPGARFPEQAAGAGGPRGPLLTLALAERIAVGVANDAGPGRLLGAGRRPLVTLHGRTRAAKFKVHPPVVWRPIEAQGFGGSEMDRIPVAAVADAVEALLTH